MQLKTLTSAALLAGATAFVAPGAGNAPQALRAEDEAVEAAPVVEAAPAAEFTMEGAGLTTPAMRSTKAPPRAWDIALDMPAGISDPFGYFDPAGIGKGADEKQAKYMRECELKHGRVAMLAAAGFPIAEHFHPLFGGNIDVPSYIAYQQTPLQTFWPVVVLYVGIVEIFSVFTFENPFGEGGFFALKDDRVPGDFGWDPMDMYPTDPAGRLEMQTKELNNGRVAMIAIAGMVAQELATGGKLF
jgi:hypothetical protein